MNYLKLSQINKLYFGLEDISEALRITLASARVASFRYQKSGFLIRLKRNIYALSEKWNLLSQEGLFCLANLIQVPSYISFTTALQFYEVTTQLQQDYIESACIKRTKGLKVKERVFSYIKIKKPLYFDFIKRNGFFIATKEKAFLDCLYLKSFGRYSFDLAAIDFGKLDKNRINRLLKKYPEKTQLLWNKICKP